MLEPQGLRPPPPPKASAPAPGSPSPSFFPIFLGHRFISFSAHKSCSKTCSLFAPLFGITSKFTWHRCPS
jgi:hypothetical protein